MSKEWDAIVCKEGIWMGIITRDAITPYGYIGYMYVQVQGIPGNRLSDPVFGEYSFGTCATPV